MNMMNRVQIPDKVVCISHSANTLWKGMNPVILPPAMGKIEVQTGFFNLGMTIDLEEEKIWIQTC